MRKNALITGVQWGGNAFPHLFAQDYIKTWRSHRFASDTQIRTTSQKSTVKQEDPMWKFMSANVRFIELFGAVFLFIWCENGVPTPLFLALHPVINYIFT